MFPVGSQLPRCEWRLFTESSPVGWSILHTARFGGWQPPHPPLAVREEHYRSMIPRYYQSSAAIRVLPRRERDVRGGASGQFAKQCRVVPRGKQVSRRLPQRCEGTIYIQTSAKTGNNITELFDHVASLWSRRITHSPPESLSSSDSVNRARVTD
jgi:hypothetical protein